MKYINSTQINKEEIKHLQHMPVNYIQRQMIHKLIEDIPFEELANVFVFEEIDNGPTTAIKCTFIL